MHMTAVDGATARQGPNRVLGAASPAIHPSDMSFLVPRAQSSANSARGTARGSKPSANVWAALTTTFAPTVAWRRKTQTESSALVLRRWTSRSSPHLGGGALRYANFVLASAGPLSPTPRFYLTPKPLARIARRRISHASISLTAPPTLFHASQSICG